MPTAARPDPAPLMPSRGVAELGGNRRGEIIYALVTRRTPGAEPHHSPVILADYCLYTPAAGHAGDFKQFTLSSTREIIEKFEHTAGILENFESPDYMKSYAYGEYAFHYIIDRPSSCWFVCMADKRVKRRIPFELLKRSRDMFNAHYDRDMNALLARSMPDLDLQLKLSGLMEEVNDPKNDRIAVLTEKLTAINDDVVESMSQLLERQDKIDLLVNRSQILSESSISFCRETEVVEQTIRGRNIRMLVAIICGALVVVVILVCGSCGITLEDC